MLELSSVSTAADDLRLFNFGEAAGRVGMSQSALRAHARLGNLKVIRCGRCVKIAAVELRRICEQGLPPLRFPKKAKAV